MPFKMLIDGQWLDAKRGQTAAVVNPATEETLCEVPYGDGEDADAAIEAAARALKGWAALGAYERGRFLQRCAQTIRDRLDELAPIMTRESGKPLSEARGEWNACADIFEWFSEEGKRAYGRVIPARKPDKRLLSVPMPVGVVATITAWNFPAYLPTRKWAAALAAGCTVVGRPSPVTPMSAMALAGILTDSGLPPGVLNLVNGDGPKMGEAFLRSPKVAKISFTGSEEVGKALMRGAAGGIKRLSLELGGSAPVLVFPDVDLERAAAMSVQAKFRNSGQVCISPSRFWVHEKVVNSFVDASAEIAHSLVVGDGMQDGVTMGPLINSASRDKVDSFVQDALDKGARAAAGARRPPDREHGFFYEPTVLSNVSGMMRLSCEEVFGPVMPISSFKDIDEALRAANSTRFGLAAYVLTNDLSTAIRAYEGLEFGIVGVNDLVPATAEGPFGGVKQSGFGREGSQEGLEEYLETKFVSIAL